MSDCPCEIERRPEPRPMAELVADLKRTFKNLGYDLFSCLAITYGWSSSLDKVEKGSRLYYLMVSVSLTAFFLLASLQSSLMVLEVLRDMRKRKSWERENMVWEVMES